MITKSVVKDYITKKCQYLTKCELEDKTLVELLKTAATSSEEYQALLSMDKEISFGDDDDGDEVFNILEMLKEHPNLKTTVDTILNSKNKNPVEQLVEQYTDNQLLGDLARKYINKQYKTEGYRCDIDQYGNEILNQKAIVDNTVKALADPNIKVIFEGQLEVGNLRARFDVLIKDENGWYTLLEAKGTNSVCTQPKDDKSIDNKVKDKYLYDLLFQYYVYKKYGLQFNSIGFITLNRFYQLGKHCYPVADDELSSFFRIKTELNFESGTISILEYFESGAYSIKAKKNSKAQPLIDVVIQEIEDIATANPVPPQKCYSCRKGPLCPFLKACFPDSDDGNSIFRLTNWGEYGGSPKGMEEIIDVRGIDKISEIPVDIMQEKYPPTKTNDKGTKNSNAFAQIAMEKGIYENKYVLDRTGIAQELGRYLNNDIDYLLFFDFESFQDPFPLVEHTSPYKQVVSQYSMHVVSKDYDLTKHDFDKGVGGGITHKEFIGNPDDDGYENPSIRLYQTLFNQLKDCGIDPYSSRYRVIVFNKNFEETRMKEFVNEFPSLCDSELIRFVDNFKNNIIDLLEFFTKGLIYSREFHGKGSLKVVQPKLIEDKDVQDFYNSQNLLFDLNKTLDYHKDGECLVFNGAICLDLYKSLLIRHHLGKKDEGLSTKKLLEEALAYCKIDSWGTVIIFDIIKNVADGKLKLDAKVK